MTTTSNPPRMIAIDGPDGVGKTTLARTLCEISKYALVHQDGVNAPSCYTFEHYANLFECQTIYDRSFASALVYGRLLTGRQAFPVTELVATRRWFKLLGGVSVCVYASDVTGYLATLEQQPYTRTELFVTARIYKHLAEAEICAAPPLPVDLFDYYVDISTYGYPDDKIVTEIMDYNGKWGTD